MKSKLVSLVGTAEKFYIEVVSQFSTKASFIILSESMRGLIKKLKWLLKTAHKHSSYTLTIKLLKIQSEVHIDVISTFIGETTRVSAWNAALHFQEPHRKGHHDDE